MESIKGISVVCPFYNEQTIIEISIKKLIKNLQKLKLDWELIIINDGSTDNSLKIATKCKKNNPRLNLISYKNNQGRGHALLMGIKSAKYPIIITTEIDLSWGEEIVNDLIEDFRLFPNSDIIIASPHLKGGKYINVPLHRVLLSKFGNLIIRAGQDLNITMFTGMTRAYNRSSILKLPLDQKGKEFHLEVIEKATALGFNIREIPAILEWKEHKFKKSKFQKRKSSTNIFKVIISHTAFVFSSTPYKYILPISLILFVISSFFLGISVINFYYNLPSLFLLITGLIIFVVSLMFFSMAVLSYQNILLRNDIWRLRKEIKNKEQTFEEC